MNFSASGSTKKGVLYFSKPFYTVSNEVQINNLYQKRQSNGQSKRQSNRQMANTIWPNSPGPLTDDWKVTDNSSVNFHDVFFFIFCQVIAKNEEKHVMEIYG